MAEPILRTDADGVWRSDDGGVSEVLIEPSEEWRSRMAAVAEVSTPPDPIDVLAAVGSALGAITSSSTSAAVRSALLNARAAIDEAIG